jgi:hypothetical protein
MAVRSILLALCVLAFAWAVSFWVDNVGAGGRPWYGWWDSVRTASGEPYTLVFRTPRDGGATARAGIRDGDRADARAQGFAARVVLFIQPTSSSATLLVRRGAHVARANLVGSSIWESATTWKLWDILPELISSIWFAGCALLIVLRRSDTVDARILALVLLCLVPGFLAENSIVVPDATSTLVLCTISQSFGLCALGLLTFLSSRHGKRSTFRSGLTIASYLTIVTAALWWAAGLIGIVTLWIDPVIFWWSSIGSILVNCIAAFTTVAASLVAVYSVPTADRPRSAWLLVPLSLSLLLSEVASSFAPAAGSWFGYVVLATLWSTLLLLGALLVTYALLKRRVLDLEFILSRTLVFATVSAIVVGAFVLLEWFLGTVLAGASHATGLIANGAVALILGLSMRFIHKRTDALVDTLFFRRRRNDEQALREYAVESGFVTDPQVLSDQVMEKLKHHTDARDAALLILEGQEYVPARTFGENHLPSIAENDGLILALKAWHKPLDPHHYATAARGALAFPLFSRGLLFGVLVLGERAHGEAYAPDEIEALAQFARGVGSAFSTLAESSASSAQSLTNALDRIYGELHAMRSSLG